MWVVISLVEQLAYRYAAHPGCDKSALMVVQSRPRVTPTEYLAADRAAARKSEYLGAEVFAMGGASERHNLIVVNVVAELRRQLKGRPCRVYPSDMRVRIKETGLYAYPDVTVVCGKRQTAKDDEDAVTNPTVIIEVLSESSEASDRGEKFAHYRRLESLQEYVLVNFTRRLVEVFRRGQGIAWEYFPLGEQDRIELKSIGVTLTLDDVYADPNA